MWTVLQVLQRVENNQHNPLIELDLVKYQLNKILVKIKLFTGYIFQYLTLS